ncbi:MAG: protein translocase subunit SecD [Actinomycetota bacterium]
MLKRHPGRLSLLTMAVVYGLLIATISWGGTPTLGLDLQGGISVNLQPVKDGQVTDDVTPEQLDQAIGVIRKRVDALGVAEPEVSRQGSTIQVQLPGATNQREVLDIVGKTAELRFRPVLEDLGQTLSGEARAEAEAKVAQLSSEIDLPEGLNATGVVQNLSAEAEANAGAQGQIPVDAAVPPPTAETSVPPPAVPEAPGTTIDPTAGDANTGGGRSARFRRQDPTPPPTTAPVDPRAADLANPKFVELYQLEQRLLANVTPAAEDERDAEVRLADKDGFIYRLGPTQLTGTAVETAAAGLGRDGQWTVNPVFKPGADGIDLFNAIAAKCNAGDPICPKVGGAENGRLAIVLDSEVLSAPSINEPTFSRDQIQISGDFTEEQAKNLAVSLRFGSLPIELAPQQAELVSATLGEGALRAGIIAGLIGLGLVFAYLFAYYRLLAIITLGSMTISASLLWIVMANLDATVTLAGVVGIIVSIGISLDSSIVFFEGWKEDVLNGATLRTTVERSFSSAYATIIKADVSSLIGAGVLYWLSVGPVRGFAFYLGIMTVFDLIAAYVFLRPTSIVLARSKWADHPRWLGIPSDTLPPTESAVDVRSGDVVASEALR